MIRVIVLVLVVLSGSLQAQCLTKYDRDRQYPHWGPSSNSDYADVRQEVIAESVVSGLVVREGRVVAGKWFDKMSGRIYDIAEVTPHIDHLLSLEVAHYAGMKCASRQLRRKFANDKRNLWAVHPTANRRKGSRVSTFVMPNQGYCTEYWQAFDVMTKDYGLKHRVGHLAAFKRYKRECKKHSKGLLLKSGWWEAF